MKSPTESCVEPWTSAGGAALGMTEILGDEATMEESRQECGLKVFCPWPLPVPASSAS